MSSENGVSFQIVSARAVSTRGEKPGAGSMSTLPEKRHYVEILVQSDEIPEPEYEFGQGNLSPETEYKSSSKSTPTSELPRSKSANALASVRRKITSRVGGGGSNSGQTKRPQVRCDTEKIARKVAQQINVAQSVYEERTQAVLRVKEED